MAYVALRKSSAQYLIDRYGNSIQRFSNGEYAIEKIRETLSNQLDTVKELSLNIYSTLGYTGSDLELVEKEFNKAIKEAQAGVSALNGLKLDQIFLDSLRKATPYSSDMQLSYEAFIAYISDKAKRSVEDDNEFRQVLYEEVIGKLPDNEQIIIDSNGKSRFKTSGRFAPNFTRAFSKLSKNLQDKIRNEYFTIPNEDKRGAKKKAKRNTKIQKIKEQITPESLSLDILLENQSTENFLRMTPEERKNLFANYPDIENRINENFIQQILNSCSGADKNYLEQSIRQVLGTKSDVFFVGGNIKDMTGILGEIQALYYLLYITKGKISNNSEWVGGINNPHSDILLTLGLKNFGIQVKNTSQQEAKKEIEFQQFNFQQMQFLSANGSALKFSHTAPAAEALSKMAPIELFNAIETILAMNIFNVEYKWYNGMAHEEANEEFHSVRETIEFFTQKAQQIAQLFSISMMYMQTTSQSNKNSNILYFISGGLVRSAGTILQQIIDEIEEKIHSFKLTMRNRSSISAKQKTIVDFLNTKGREDYEKGKGMHDLNFTLQSSFTFTD